MSARKNKWEGVAIALGVDGEGVSPKSFDVASTLRFITAFVGLMEGIAKAEDSKIHLDGLEIRKGSMAAALRSASTGHDIGIATKARLSVVGDTDAPRGLQGKVDAVRESLQLLPPAYTPFIETQSDGRVDLPTSFPEPAGYVEVTTVYGVVSGVGGKHPTVRIATEDDGVYVVRTTRALAKHAGSHLYEPIEATVIVHRVGEKRIDVRLEDFVVLQEMSPEEESAVWREWFARSAPEWDDVDDVEYELRKEDVE